MEFEVSAELVGIYLEDAREHLAVLDDALLQLERAGPAPEVVTSLLGPLHTLKGNSGMIGLIGVKDYVHRLEDAFARVRDGSLGLTPAVLQCLFEGASALREAWRMAVPNSGGLNQLPENSSISQPRWALYQSNHTPNPTSHRPLESERISARPRSNARRDLSGYAYSYPSMILVAFVLALNIPSRNAGNRPYSASKRLRSETE